MNKKKLEEKLKEINDLITINYSDLKQLGVLAGLSGISLFKFYYSKYLDIDEHADLGVDMLSDCIDKINEGYSFPTFCAGIAGFGWVFDHLEEVEFMDADGDELLSQFDDYIYNFMKSDMEKGNYDYLHGAIGYAFYFYNRYRNTKSTELKTKYTKILLEFIDLLDGLSEKEGGNKLKWESTLNIETGEKGYNLSLSHGMSSIVGILTKLYEFEDFKSKSHPLLLKSINYIRSHKIEGEDPYCLFPSWVKNEDNEKSGHSRMAWCYGDLGVGIRFWFAGKILNDDELKNEAISILKHASKRTSNDDSLVLDAGVCHGSYGNAQIFNRMYKETKEPLFKEAADFWIQHGLDSATHEGGYAGYKQWHGVDKNWSNELTLLEGIAGIGLTIIDQLSEDSNFTWDECLMIS